MEDLAQLQALPSLVDQTIHYYPKPYASDNIVADNNTIITAKANSRLLAVKEDCEIIQLEDKLREEEDLAKQNYQMKQEIEALLEKINYLEQINQQADWSKRYLIDIQGRAIPLKITVNSAKQEIVSVEIDFDYIKKKKRESREQHEEK